jgi:single-stranded-DNA-specific exonuclease
MEIKNLKKAAERIKKAVKDNERIIIYGDSDMDGVSSVIILKEAITTIGASNYMVYFPDREGEGYGINEKSLATLKEKSPALFVSLDCGIGNVSEVETANKMGFEVIIIDHHEVLSELPKASIIVDPKQKGDESPFNFFANVGLTYKLAKYILGDKMPESLRKNFLELTAMATIADMMPREGENEDIIIEGISYLENTWRPGLQALFGLEEVKGMTLMEKVIKVNSILNIRDVRNGLPAAYRVLTEKDKESAQKMAKELLEKSIEKKLRIKEIVKEVERNLADEEIVFQGKESWELILLGVVAAIVLKHTGKPVFLYKKNKEESQGSCRSTDEFNSVEAMKTCSDMLLTYGGHPKASGFKIKNKNLDKFKEGLIEYYNKK